MDAKAQVDLIDRASDFFGETTRSYTSQGFLKVKGRVARSGIQRYYGFELGMKDEPYKLKSLYRPPEVVLSDAVCEMFDGVDVTMGHPKDFVDAANYRSLTSGVVLGKAHIDPDNPNFIVCDMLIKDADTIKAIEAGTVGLSVGYRNTMDLTPGISPDGEPYDAKVEAITLVNHVALVSRPRAGIEARVLDAEEGVSMKTVKIADQAVDLADEVAEVISKHIDALESRAAAAESNVALKDEEIGALEAKIEGLEADLAEAKSHLMTDEDLHEVLRVADELRSDARKIAAEFVCDSFDSLEIMKAAIKQSGSSVDLADKSEDFIAGFFKAAVAAADAKGAVMNDSQAAVAEALKGSVAKQAEAATAPDRAFLQKQAEAWKTA